MGQETIADFAAAERKEKQLKKVNKGENIMKQVKISELAAGSRFSTDIGKFIVLEQLEGSTKVITEDLYRKGIRFDYESADYKESSLIELCDGIIREEFAEIFGEDNIIKHEADLTTVDMQKDYGKIACKVRPLTFDEVRKYNHLLANPKLKDWWWLVTPWSTARNGYKYAVTVVSPCGSFNSDYCGCNFGVRPFCILKSDIFVSQED